MKPISHKNRITQYLDQHLFVEKPIQNLGFADGSNIITAINYRQSDLNNQEQVFFNNYQDKLKKADQIDQVMRFNCEVEKEEIRGIDSLLNDLGCD